MSIYWKWASCWWSLDVPGSNGQLLQQVFEYSSLYSYIATQGVALRAMQSVLHPINGGWIQWDQALALVPQVSPKTQEIFNAEQLHWELP